MGLPNFSSQLELWKFCININNPKFPKVPPNVTSGMDWYGDASVALERSIISPFMSIPSALAFSIYVYWFNAHGKSTWLASIRPIILICLNLPSSEGLKPENVYVSGIIPGLKEPTALQLNYLLMPLIKELKEPWQGYHFSHTSTVPSGSFIYVAILTAIADVVSMHNIVGFISHSGNHFCNFCTIHKAQIEEIGPQFHYTLIPKS
ncbi:hypothetical protein O181_011030 [Austropuccinia psidii MF-1]|uniref:Uncharacterized protein n=1 Tax=Austropuccinia psidii MF-1 TaxID=1389203 RepID=A0A9Q3BV43_9BASI|nr:hypothetical protein [Austropuccinia psidii MF-1]